MGTETCWDILGIQPTRDKLAVKRAFAKLAHTISPEDDPDGYRRIHDAYKQALKYAEFRAQQAEVKNHMAETKKAAEQAKNVPADNEPEENAQTVNAMAKSTTPQFATQPAVTPQAAAQPTEKPSATQPAVTPQSATPPDIHQPAEAALPYDFSSVVTNEREYSNEVDQILDAIVTFKTSYGVDTKKNVERWQITTVKQRAIRLFGLYCALYEKSEDESVWDLFFEEPLTEAAMLQPEFKDELLNKYEEDSETREIIAEKIGQCMARVRASMHVISEKKVEQVKRNSVGGIIGLATLFGSFGAFYATTLRVIPYAFYGLTVIFNVATFILFFLFPKDAIKDNVTSKTVKDALFVRNAMVILVNVLYWGIIAMAGFECGVLDWIVIIICGIAGIVAATVLCARTAHLKT